MTLRSTSGAHTLAKHVGPSKPESLMQLEIASSWHVVLLAFVEGLISRPVSKGIAVPNRLPILRSKIKFAMMGIMVNECVSRGGTAAEQ